VAAVFVNPGIDQQSQAAVSVRSAAIFAASFLLLITPLATPPARATPVTAAAVPAPAVANLFNSARTHFFPPLQAPRLKPTSVLESPVHPLPIAWTVPKAPASFPALTPPAPRMTFVVPGWMSPTPPLPSTIFSATRFIPDIRRDPHTVFGRPEVPKQEFQPQRFTRAPNLFPPLQNTPRRQVLAPEQVPQFLPSTVWTRAPLFPPSFSVIPGPIPADSLDFSPVAAPAISVQGLPGDWLQVQDEGLNLGNANVAVIDFRGDPAVILATRGVGENSHVVTVRIANVTPPPQVVPGWDTTNESGTWTFTDNDFTATLG
jgi:hypothetical protein